MTSTQAKNFPFMSTVVRFSGLVSNNFHLPVTGFLLGQQKEGQFVIKLTPVKNDTDILTSRPFTVNTQRMVEPIIGDNGIYTVEIPVYSNGREGYTKSGENNVCMVAMRNPGQICLYESGIVSQRGKHYFFIHRKYETTLVQDEFGKQALQGLEWQHLINFLKKHTTIVPKIVQSSQIQPPKAIERDNRLSHKEGRVAWFDPFSNSGAVMTKKGLAKFHYNDIRQKMNAMLNPQPGQPVKIERLVPPPANFRTTFKLLAKGVEIV